MGQRPDDLWSELRGLTDYRELLRNLIGKDLKVKYRGSYLGFLWSLLNPLTLILVYSFVLGRIFNPPIENYTLFVITGIIPWVFSSGAIVESTNSILGNANLVKQIYFPREVLPMATVLFYFTQFCLALAVFLPAVWFFRGDLPATLTLYPLVALLHWAFVIGLSLVLSAITTFFKDVRYLTEVTIMVAFWATPVLYSPEMIGPKLLPWFLLNPFSSFFFSYQNVVYYGRLPESTHLASMMLWTTLSLCLGLFVFRRTRSRFAEEL